MPIALKAFQRLAADSLAGAVGVGQFGVLLLKLDKPGKLSPVEYDQMVADLVNYLVFMAEPARSSRTTIGMFVLFALGLLFILAYALKKEYWKDVH